MKNTNLSPSFATPKALSQGVELTIQSVGLSRCGTRIRIASSDSEVLSCTVTSFNSYWSSRCSGQLIAKRLQTLVGEEVRLWASHPWNSSKWFVAFEKVNNEHNIDVFREEQNQKLLEQYYAAE